MIKKTLTHSVGFLQVIFLGCAILAMHAQLAQGATFIPIHSWASPTMIWGYDPLSTSGTSTGIFLGAADVSSVNTVTGPGASGTLGYAAFTMGGSLQSAGNAGSANNSSGSSVYTGDVGVAANYTNAGTTSQTINPANNQYSFNSMSSSTITGKLIIDTGLKINNSSTTVTGGTMQNAAASAALAQGVYDAVNATNQAAALAASSPSTYTFTGYNSVTSGTYELNIQNNAMAQLTLGPNSDTVIKLKDLMLQNSTFNLVGTATSKLILDVTGQFNLQNNAKITLSGGITWNDVLINVIGAGQDIAMSNSTVNGYVLAAQRNLMMSNKAVINGEAIIGGPQIYLSGGSQIIKPTVVSR